MLVSKKFIPSLFTILNAFCGFLSIVNAANGQFETASWFIVYATLFDMVDGLVARMLKTSSDFGVELDSLSDVISFGVAPSFLLYSIFFKDFEGIGIALASLIMVFSAIRLARFNVELIGYDKDKFKGLPTPIASVTICSYLIFYHNKIFSDNLSYYLIFILVIALPILMISRFTYITLPKLSKKSIKKNFPIFLILISVLIIIGLTKGKSAFPFVILYILSGIIMSITKMFTKRKPPRSEKTEVRSKYSEVRSQKSNVKSEMEKGKL